MIPNYLRAALISGTFVGGVVFASRHCDPFTVGLLATVPIGILSFLFINPNLLSEYKRGYEYGFLAAIIAIIFFLTIVQSSKPIKAYAFSVMLWISLAAIIFFLQN